MTMHINLSKEMEAYIRSKVEGGFYGNATEVIRDAIRRMHDEDAQLTVFQAAVDEGETELERGEGILGTDTTIRDIAREVAARHDVKTYRAHG